MSVIIIPVEGGGAAAGLTCSPWATPQDLCPPCSGMDLDAGLVADSLQAASDILFLLSGRRWPGVCEDVVRPCARTLAVDSGRPIRSGWWAGTSAPSGYAPGAGPPGWGGSWGWCTCNMTGRSGCNSVPEIQLGGSPIVDIVEVLVDGAPLAPTAYRVDDKSWLVRTDGQAWNCCQNMMLAASEKDTWQVTYHYGTPPTALGRRAAAVLACQFALAGTPGAAGQCRLPERTTNIVRQGLTVAVNDPTALLKEGRFGLLEVDAFLSAVNPYRLGRRATATGPEQGRRVRRTTWP